MQDNLNTTPLHPVNPLDEQRYETLKRFSSLLGFYSPSENAENDGSIMARTRDKTPSPETPAIRPGASSVSNVTAESESTLSAKELIRQQQAAVQSGKSSAPLHRKALAAVVGKYLRRDDADPTGGAILRLPALELDSPDDLENHSAGGADSFSDLMPTPGKSHARASMIAASESSPPLPAVPNPAQPDTTPLSSAPQPPKKPAMAASLLHMMTMVEPNPVTPSGSQSLSSSTLENPTISSLPTPTPTPKSAENSEPVAPDPTKQTVGSMISNSNSDTTNLEMKAATNLGRPLSFTRSSAYHAPSALIRSIFSSFSALIASRVKTWMLVLLRHSLSSEERGSRDRLMALLGTENKIQMNAIITTFEVDDLSTEEIAALLVKGSLNMEKRKNSAATGKSCVGIEFCDLILPLQFKAVIDVTVQGHSCTVNLTAPGSIGALFSGNEALISFAEVKIDTNTLIGLMVKQARLLAFQAVSRATAVTKEASKPTSNRFSSLSLFDNVPNDKKRSRSSKDSAFISPEDVGNSSTISISPSVSSNASRGKLSAEKFAPSLRGQGSFALKKASKSVQWDTSTLTLDGGPRDRKRMRKPMLSGPVLKRSAISFGKPDADIFESSRNATFGEFGHVKQSPHVRQKKSGSRQSAPNSYLPHLLQRKRVSSSVGSSSNFGDSTNAQFGLSKSKYGSGSLRSKMPSFQDLSRSAVYSVAPPSASCLSSYQKLSNASLARTPTQLESLYLSSQTRPPNKDPNEEKRTR